MGAGWRMWRKLVDRLAVLVAVRRFSAMGAADSRSLRSDSYVRMEHFFRRYTYDPFRRFWGDVRRDFLQATSLYCSSWYLGFLSPRHLA
jgi:hypothetical protein